MLVGCLPALEENKYKNKLPHNVSPHDIIRLCSSFLSLPGPNASDGAALGPT